MNETTIDCPRCNHSFKLNESLAAPFVDQLRREFEQKLSTRDNEISKKESEIRERSKALEMSKASLDAQIAERVEAARKGIVEQEAKNARLLTTADLAAKDAELGALRRVIEERENKLAEAQRAQVDVLRKQRELDDAKREIELTIETKVQQSLNLVREKAKLDAEEGLKLRVTEKEEQISSMQRQIEELRRKAEQSSQQLQGEALELALESLLREKFSSDQIEPVPKGEFGGDIVQRVFAPDASQCGTILWESKRTKTWNEGWLAKLRNDQRAAKADVAALISEALPKGVNGFDYRDGVWIIEPRCIIPVAIMLRHYLAEMAGARRVGQGQQTKTELVYQYLTGPRFRLRVEAIVEKFTDMQLDLDRERKAMTRLWAKREAQIAGVIESTAGMYGDLQGIAGKTMAEIEGLSIPLLESPDPKGAARGVSDDD